jgi:hypothetical protein
VKTNKLLAAEPARVFPVIPGNPISEVEGTGADPAPKGYSITVKRIVLPDKGEMEEADFLRRANKRLRGRNKGEELPTTNEVDTTM